MSAASGASSLTGLAGASGDATSIAALRSAAARDPKAAIRETAKQFEALFMQQLMKSMREATMSSGMLDNSGTQLGTEMLDTQYANKMSGLPGGLAAAIARQLERQLGSGAAAALAAPAARARPGAPGARRLRSTRRRCRRGRSTSSAPTRMRRAPPSRRAASRPRSRSRRRRTSRAGASARSATPTGTSSHNLFGIKAGPGWSGPVAEITTTEYVGGEAQKVTAKFRSYASYGESFRDYARLMKESPRYAGVVAQAAQAPASAASAHGFAHGLQRAGYATDPAYADKLGRSSTRRCACRKVIS
jgi:flagellar protein FlgJ